jgi:2-alkyl-3-oxoalkanoate reductase
MRALVTGATGFLGGATLERLLHHGESDLRILARATSTRQRIDALRTQYPSAKLTIIEGSLVHPEQAAAAVQGVDIIYHLAAAPTGAAADLFLNTVVGTKNLLEPLAAMPTLPKVVHVSSFGVYGTAGMDRGALLTEAAPLEPNPEKRDLYSQSKLRQEQLVREYQRQLGFPLVVLRPGVVYGPGGGAISSRVGLSLFGLFLFMGGKNVLPLTYVDNCAEAIAVVGRNPASIGETYNVVDDDLPTASEFLRAYQREVGHLKVVPLPFSATQAMSILVEKYHFWSKGQLPAVFTPYKSKSTWGGNVFDNSKLKAASWQPIVSTADGLKRHFEFQRKKRADV